MLLLRFGRRALLRLARLVVGDFGLRRLALAVSLRGMLVPGDEDLKIFVGPVFADGFNRSERE